MIWETWAIIAVFIINLLFFIVMSIVSPYYKKITTEGMGRIMNITWIIVIIIVAAVLMFYNVQCALSGTSRGKTQSSNGKTLINPESCSSLAIAIVVTLAVGTVGVVVWGIVNDIRYRRKLSQATQTPTKVNVIQESK